jgi:hypothetical protein
MARASKLVNRKKIQGNLVRTFVAPPPETYDVIVENPFAGSPLVTPRRAPSAWSAARSC